MPNSVGMSDMVQYWPNVQKAVNDTDYTQFWANEWSSHGTCSGLSQIDYFSLSLGVIKQVGTPASLSNAVYKSIDTATLKIDMGGPQNVALLCSSGYYLVGAYLCLTQVDNKPDQLVECPQSILALDSCTFSSVTVAGF